MVEERFDSDGIRKMYESTEYPFRRQPPSNMSEKLTAKRAPF
jgi:hypothetical protein